MSVAPSSDVERQRAEVGGRDLRWLVGWTVGIVGGMPQADARAGLLSAGSPGSLVSRCSAGRDGAQRTHTAAVIDLGPSALAGVDHRGHTVDRHAGFGEWGCQHDLATPRGRVAAPRPGHRRATSRGVASRRARHRDDCQGPTTDRSTRVMAPTPGRKTSRSPAWASEPTASTTAVAARR